MERRELPEGWEWRSLGDETELIMGQSPPGSSYNERGDGIPFLQGNAEFGDFFPTHKKYTSNPSKIARRGTILISVRAPVGDINIANVDYCIGRGLASISLKNGENKYLFYLLKSLKPLIESKGTGSTFKAISKAIINEIEIPLPPLPVQRRIVEILEQADALRHLRAQADAEMQKLLQSVFYEMFGDPVRNEKGWEIRKIEDLCSVVTDGEHITPIRKDLGIYLLSARNIQNHKIALSDVDFIDNEEYNRISQRIKPKRSDILLSCSGTIGRVAQIKTEEKFQLVRSVALLRPIEHLINPTYLEYSFDTHFLKNQIQKNVHQSSQGNLFQGKIKQLKVIVPPMNLQIHFARITQKVESVQANQKESHEEIFHLFDGLMTGLFKGEYLTKVT